MTPMAVSPTATATVWEAAEPVLQARFDMDELLNAGHRRLERLVRVERALDVLHSRSERRWRAGGAGPIAEPDGVPSIEQLGGEAGRQVGRAGRDEHQHRWRYTAHSLYILPP